MIRSPYTRMVLRYLLEHGPCTARRIAYSTRIRLSMVYSILRYWEKQGVVVVARSRSHRSIYTINPGIRAEMKDQLKQMVLEEVLR